MNKKPIILKHIDGREVSFSSITEFSRKYNINRHHISQILNRNGRKPERYFHHGWYDPSPVEPLPIKLLNKNDDLIIIRNVPEFILQTGISSKMVNKLLFKSGYIVNGYRKVDTRKPVIFKTPKIKYYFKSPNNKIFETYSVRSFSKRFPHLNYRSLYYLVSGNTNKIDYKGWTLHKVEEIK